MSKPFNNRVFGCAIIKSINSNFNADFTHQPRTLPDGRVYATDKALKYSVRHYLKNTYPEEVILYYRRNNDKLNPLSLDETYTASGLGDFEKDDKPKVLASLLRSIDVRLFGSTFAAKSKAKKINLSVHGPVQINHGVNRFPKNEIYSEQITSPFRSDSDVDKEAGQTTLGRQSKLKEGHYVYHFSVNPQNLNGLIEVINRNDGSATGLSADDISKLKEALSKGVSYFDSSSKAGSENELLFWVQLKENSKLVLPSFTEMVKIDRKEGEKVQIDLSAIKALLDGLNQSEIESMELHYMPETTELSGVPENAQRLHLVSGEKI